MMASSKSNLKLLKLVKINRRRRIGMSTEWSLSVGLTMIICNIVAIALGKFFIQQKGAGPALPGGPFFGGMGLPELLATTSLGHILGAGTILGLSSAGMF